MPGEQDLHELRVTVPGDDGLRHIYLYDPQPDPASLEATVSTIDWCTLQGRVKHRRAKASGRPSSASR